MVNLSSLSFLSPLLQIVVFHSEALALSGHRHSGIMNVNQAPAVPYFLIELRFAAVGGEEGDVWRIQPDVSGESGIGGVDRFRVFVNQAADRSAVGGRFL